MPSRVLSVRERTGQATEDVRIGTDIWNKLSDLLDDTKEKDNPS